MAKHPAWGAADNFYRAFKSQGIDVVLLCLRRDPYRRTTKGIVTFLNKKNVDFWFKKATKKENKVMVISPSFLSNLGNKKWFGRSNVSSFFKNLTNNPFIFITGTLYMRESDYWNKYLDDHNFKTRFCTPDVVRFNIQKNIPLLHPMQYDNVDKTKSNKILVSHAPGLVHRPGKKGSKIIERGIELAKQKVDFDYDYIVGVLLQECLKRKAKSHIFIDQINPTVGGVGKNGLEAIALNCITLCSINNFEKSVGNDYYKKSPIMNVMNENDVAKTLVDLISNKSKLKDELEIVSKWKKLINYENTVKYMLSVLR